jgi:hypothetical protein
MIEIELCEPLCSVMLLLSRALEVESEIASPRHEQGAVMEPASTRHAKQQEKKRDCSCPILRFASRVWGSE